MSGSGSGRKDPQPKSTSGSERAESADAPSGEEQDRGKENHEQKIKRWLHKINPVERLSRRDSRTRKSERQDDQPSERRSRERERPSRRQESNHGFSNFGNRIKRTFSFTGNDGAKAEPSPDPMELSTRSPKAKPKSETGHSKAKPKLKEEAPAPANDLSMAPTTFEPVNAPRRPANPAMSREVIRKEEKPTEKEPASTRTQFEVVNAAVRPAECHGPLNPKKKPLKPPKEPKSDASEREEPKTDAVALREKPGASVTQYKIVYSASKGKQIPRYIPDTAPTNLNNNKAPSPIVKPSSPTPAPPSPEPPKATSSPKNEQQAKVEEKDTPASCYMFYQR